MSENPNPTAIEFIPADESPLFIRLFGWYTKWLFRYRFKAIWIKQKYLPKPGDKTIYYLNHSSWWDGLIPLLLNQYLFNQNARAMMEDKQMVRYRLFKKIGAFSVNLCRPRSSIRSLRYAMESMDRENASLFIYPEGKMVPFSTDKPEFQGGLSWLCQKLPGIHIVPIGIYIHTLRHEKPELHIQIGKRVDWIPEQFSSEELKEKLEKELRKLLIDLEENGGFRDEHFKQWKP